MCWPSSAKCAIYWEPSHYYFRGRVVPSSVLKALLLRVFVSHIDAGILWAEKKKEFGAYVGCLTAHSKNLKANFSDWASLSSTHFIKGYFNVKSSSSSAFSNSGELPYWWMTLVCRNSEAILGNQTTSADVIWFINSDQVTLAIGNDKWCIVLPHENNIMFFANAFSLRVKKITFLHNGKLQFQRTVLIVYLKAFFYCKWCEKISKSSIWRFWG